MAFTPELIDELELLALFNLNNTQEGLKVHHTADGKAVDVLKIEGDGAEAVLAEAGFAVLAPEEVYCVDPA